MSIDVLIVGNSAREDALGFGVQQSPECGKVYFAPGNGGTAQRGENVAIPPTDVAALASFAAEKHIDLTIVGGEEPLPLGIVDEFRKRKMTIFGPTAAAAQAESSKDFAKTLFHENGVPTAAHRSFTSHREATAYLDMLSFPAVIKADGLAQGKGSRICQTREDADRALQDLMVQRIFGDKGATVVIEEFLHGRESSVHALSDGKDHVLIPTAWQDHKYLGAATADHSEGMGEMTGGMGTYNPVPWMSGDVMHRIDKMIVLPILDGLRKKDASFTGCLFPGLMMMEDGSFKVLETNVRPGAPETESWMRNMQSTLEVFFACARGKLNAVQIQMDTRAVVSLVLASGGYPGAYPKGLEIVGIEEAKGDPDVEVFHAGTAMREGKLVTNGGRVLTVSATADTLLQAQKAAYTAADSIRFLDEKGRDTKYVRPDIAHQAFSYQS